jgi:glycosyltransferase involved in cell wall biosynthesis
MAASKPVISTHTGGVGEIISESKTGFLVSPGNMKKISERLFVLLKDKNLRMQMGKDACKALDFNFTLLNMINKTQNLYTDTIRNKEVAYAN